MSPPLVVLLLTYEGPGGRRTKYAQRTVATLRNQLQHDGEVYWHIADDGSSEEHLKAIEWSARSERGAAHEIAGWSTSNSKRRGYGANMNGARAYIDAALPPGLDHLLIVEDDWELQRPLRLGEMIAMMDERPEVGMVRLSYMAYTAPLLGQFVATSDGHMWLRLQRDCPEGFIFSGHPRLEHVGFSADFAWNDAPGMLPGDVELDAAFRYKMRGDGDRREVVWPLDFTPAAASAQSYFGHIGAEASYD